MEGETEPLWKYQSITEEYQWEVYIRTLTGKVITVRCNETDLIADIKYTIERKEGIPLLNQRLVKRETCYIESDHPEKGTQSKTLSWELILMQVDTSTHMQTLPTQPGEEPAVIPELVTINVQSSTGQKYRILMLLSTIKTFSGDSFTIQVTPDDTVESQKIIYSGRELENHTRPVSYTHLTLPTIYSV